MNFQYVEIDEVYAIHHALIKQAGTKATVRDFAFLHSLAENHPFTDGNKRTAWITTKRFLYINGYHLKANVSEASDFMVAVDNEKLGLKVIYSWLKRHSKKI